MDLSSSSPGNSYEHDVEDVEDTIFVEIMDTGIARISVLPTSGHPVFFPTLDMVMIFLNRAAHEDRLKASFFFRPGPRRHERTIPILTNSKRLPDWGEVFPYAMVVTAAYGIARQPTDISAPLGTVGQGYQEEIPNCRVQASKAA